jgi:hypothetical protein
MEKIKILNPFFLEFYRMFFQWREHEHEDVDNTMVEDDDSMNALCQCGMYKLFQMNDMQEQRIFLNILVDY